MNDQTRKALELAREALTGCTDSLEYVNRLALGAVDFDVRYERISIAGKAIAAIDAALADHADPVALETERDQLRAELEALRADAERYQWLRDTPCSFDVFAEACPASMDKDVDAARKQQ